MHKLNLYTLGMVLGMVYGMVYGLRNPRFGFSLGREYAANGLTNGLKAVNSLHGNPWAMYGMSGLYEFQFYNCLA